MKRNEIILSAIIEECRKHQLRLDYAYGKLAPKIPFTPNRDFSDEVVAGLDQYVFRFSKLQDAMGQKLFKGVLQFLGEEVSDKPFLDIFNRLEQLGIVKDYDLWNELRILRNQISHEYDENKQELIENLNRIINSKANLEKYLVDVLVYLSERGWKVAD